MKGEKTMSRKAYEKARMKAVREVARAESRLDRRKKVLVVDDEASIRECLTEYLLHKGFEVTPASGCLDGLLETMSRSPDFVILDLNTPDVPGTFLYHHIERVDQDLANRTIFITGLDENHPLYQKAVQTGATVLAKPFSFSRLSAILDNYGAV